MYVPSKGATQEHLNDGYKSLLSWFTRWIHRKVALNDNASLTKEQWYELEQDEFNEYRMYQGKVATTAVRPTAIKVSTEAHTD